MVATAMCGTDTSRLLAVYVRSWVTVASPVPWMASVGAAASPVMLLASAGMPGKFRVPLVPGADLSCVVMDLSSEDDPDSSKLLRSFDEVWHDQLTWEELRSTRHGRVLKKVGDGILSVESAPVLLFGACSGVEAFPCDGEAPDEQLVPAYDSVWSPSPYRVRRPDPENETTECFIDLGPHMSKIFDRDIGVD